MFETSSTLSPLHTKVSPLATIVSTGVLTVTVMGVEVLLPQLLVAVTVNVPLVFTLSVAPTCPLLQW